MSQNRLATKLGLPTTPWEVAGIYPDAKPKQAPAAYRAGQKAGRVVKESRTLTRETYDYAKLATTLAIAALGRLGTSAGELKSEPRPSRSKPAKKPVTSAPTAVPKLDNLKPKPIKQPAPAKTSPKRLAVAKEFAAKVGSRTAEAKNSLRLSAEKLGARRHKAADYITTTAGRAMMGKVIATSPEVARASDHSRRSLKDKLTFTNPLSQLLEKARPPRMNRRAKAAATVGALLLSTVPSSSARDLVMAEQLETAPRAPAAASGSRPTIRPSAIDSSLNSTWSAPRVEVPRAPSVMDSNLPSTWAAPDAKDRVVSNAPPVPSINAIEHAAQLQQVAAAVAAERYNQFEINRARSVSGVNRIPVVTPANLLDTYQGRGEQAEIDRLAAQAEAAAEAKRIQAEREVAVGNLQPGQLMATVTFTQTGEAEGAPAGPYTIFHGVRVGVPEVEPGGKPTAYDFDQGYTEPLEQGFFMYTLANVPMFDEGKNTQFSDMPIVIAGHNRSTIHDPLNPESTDVLRYVDKTKVRNPETGEAGDILTMTFTDGSIRQFEAVSMEVVDTRNYDEAYQTVFGEGDLNMYNCLHPGGVVSEDTPYRTVVHFEDITTEVGQM